jgi:urea transporter
MSATASCKFPLLDQWKEFSAKNKVLSLIDDVISGYAQIAFTDNTFSGLLMIFATYLASPIAALSGVWATFVATVAAHIFGVPKGAIKCGVYGFNPALAGLAIGILCVFPDMGRLLLFSGIAGIFCVVFQMALVSLLSKWDVPPLALPYCITMTILIPATLSLSGLQVSGIAQGFFEVGQASGPWTSGEFVTAALNGLAQVLWVDNPLTGILYLVAVLMASRIDVLSIIIGTVASTLLAIALGLPKGMVFAGIFGYNAVLVMHVLTRGFLINARTYLFAVIMASLTVVLGAGFRVIMAPIGAISFFAIPYAVTCVLAFLGRDMLKNFTYVPSINWGVPETIAKEFKPEQDVSSTEVTTAS